MRYPIPGNLRIPSLGESKRERVKYRLQIYTLIQFHSENVLRIKQIGFRCEKLPNSMAYRSALALSIYGHPESILRHERHFRGFLKSIDGHKRSLLVLRFQREE